MAGTAGRTIGKLSALRVAAAKAPGMYGDGAGLYLKVDEGGSRSWILRYKVAGRSRKLGLGPVHTVSLALARDKAADARRLLLDGKDPIEVKRAARAAHLLEAAKTISFDDCAANFVATNKAAWRSEKHVGEWMTSLQRYASPVFGKLAVADVDRGLIVRALEPIWSTKPETASRVRQRVERVLSYAKANGYRDGENPAAWKGNLDHILPRADKIKAVKHFAAMPHNEVATLMARLAPLDEVAAAALRFTILTAARSGEVLGAQWSEIDLESAIWTVPGVRMKTGRQHRIPLSDPAISILNKMQAGHPHGGHELVFPGRKPGKGIGETSMAYTMRGLGIGAEATVHGFRSSFRDWCSEQTAFPREVAEACLAHTVGDKVELAYRRTEFIVKRRALMTAWARYITAPSADTNHVIPIRRGS